ncbi:MAG: dTDP-4-dehydrorhamnose reductase [Elusimicrobia bacterium RIFCSPLOWO2_01_FULL_54_10]|nr:MAG: dTDP-4-dehydrorhamnose reductase [Elusimicrobia bacterium RIFCSPLOWO2_01_FULL_54_10]
MRIVITGTSGLVGHDLWPVLNDSGHETWGIGRKKPEAVPFNMWRTVDIVDQDTTANAIEKINPDCVIHLAALSNPDDCEKDPETAYKANALGTRNLALACQKFDSELMYVSTDQVFDGKKKSPYTELDKTNPVNHYGLSKAWGEEFTQTLLRRFYIVRTALVFGTSRPTFIPRIVRSASSGDPVVAATDIVNSPTYSQDLARALGFLAATHAYGTYHVVNEGYCNRYELSKFIAESLGAKTGFIKKGTQASLKLPAKRPGYTPMDNFAWNLQGFPKMRPWKEAILSFLEESNNL